MRRKKLFKLNDISFRFNGHVERTEVSAPTQNPIWNATLIFQNVKADELLKRFVEIQLWDMVPHAEFVFLGLCTVDIQKALMDDGATWCRLEEIIDVKSSNFNVSLDLPSTTVSVEHMQRLRRSEQMRSSSSDDVDSIGDATSLLHPDHAWASGSRRGSSQSEKLNVESYQLGKDYSHSLPGSRRSSFQDSQGNTVEKTDDSTIFNSLCITRRRSSCTRREPDEFLKSPKGSKTKLGRTLSASSSEKRLTKTK